MSALTEEIIESKNQAGDNAFLWLHNNGLCVLWPSEKEYLANTDDLSQAIESWTLNKEDVEDMFDTQYIDERG